METYENMRASINTGDLFFTKSHRIFSRLIRFFTQSDVSHVGVFLWEQNRLLCCEMLEGKDCIITAASIRLDEDFYVGKLATINASDEEIKSFCWDSAWRKKYSLLRAFLSLFRPSKNQEICSEFASECTKQTFHALKRGILPIDMVAKCKSFTPVTRK